MRIELTNGDREGWSDAMAHVTVTVGGKPFFLGWCCKSDLPREICEFADGLMRGKQFAPEIGSEPAFNVGFEHGGFFVWLWKPRFRNRWLHWVGSTQDRSSTEPVDDAVSYLRSLNTDIAKA